MVERTDDHPGTGSATYCSAVSLRQASRILVLAQRSYANKAARSSCMGMAPRLREGIQGVAGRAEKLKSRRQSLPQPTTGFEVESVGVKGFEPSTSWSRSKPGEP